MSVFNYSELESLVKKENFKEAEAFCLAALASEPDHRFWETQLGYLYFLNEKDSDSFYNRAPTVFESLVANNAVDVNAHFWLGWIYMIVLNDSESAQRELREALALDPNHPYANLALASRLNAAEGAELLRRTLKQQPTNFRALRDLADVFLTVSKKTEARSLLKLMLTYEAYIERSYGIMNQYINDVLTGATHEQSWREEARSQLNQLQNSL